VIRPRLHRPPLPVSVHLDVLEELAEATRSKRVNRHQACRRDGSGAILVSPGGGVTLASARDGSGRTGTVLRFSRQLVIDMVDGHWSRWGRHTHT
jgi:hypothetical protein